MTAGQERDLTDNSPYGPPRGVLQLEESRRSFQRQVEQLKDIDDKAMRSVRTAVVAIGFVVTAVGITLRDGSVSLGVGPTLFTGVGVFFLTVTILAGVGTYSVTEYRGRLTDAERARLDQPTGTPLKRDAELVRIYHSWLDSTEDELSESAAFLTATLLALTVGMLCLSVAAALAAFEAAPILENRSSVQAVVLNLGVVVSVFAAIGLATKLTIRSVNAYL